MYFEIFKKLTLFSVLLLLLKRSSVHCLILMEVGILNFKKINETLLNILITAK
jgi:hypothetical protein